MHELGHNLGLHHGGAATAIIGRTSNDYQMNCKPNYLSVMSYARQMPWDWVSPKSSSGLPGDEDLPVWEGEKLSGNLNYRQDATKISTMLDYSATTAPQQNEDNLNEGTTGGTTGGTKPADGKKYQYCFLQVKLRNSNRGDERCTI